MLWWALEPAAVSALPSRTGRLRSLPARQTGLYASTWGCACALILADLSDSAARITRPHTGAQHPPILSGGVSDSLTPAAAAFNERGGDTIDDQHLLQHRLTAVLQGGGRWASVPQAQPRRCPSRLQCKRAAELGIDCSHATAGSRHRQCKRCSGPRASATVCCADNWPVSVSNRQGMRRHAGEFSRGDSAESTAGEAHR